MFIQAILIKRQLCSLVSFLKLKIVSKASANDRASVVERFVCARQYYGNVTHARSRPHSAWGAGSSCYCLHLYKARRHSELKYLAKVVQPGRKFSSTSSCSKTHVFNHSTMSLINNVVSSFVNKQYCIYSIFILSYWEELGQPGNRAFVLIQEFE